MILTRLAVRNPIGVLMVCLGVLVLATISASRIPIDMFPSLNVPALRIDSKYPGASPEEIERTITYPLEQAIARVAGVVRVESDSSPGSSQITLWFDWGSNLDSALVQVISNVQRAMNTLPEGLDPPAVSQFDVADFPVLQLAMHSPGLTPAQAYELGEYVIGPQLSRIPGVSESQRRADQSSHPQEHQRASPRGARGGHAGRTVAARIELRRRSGRGDPASGS